MSDLPVLDAHAAFVDVGSEQMHVSIAGGPPAVFGTVTTQLHALRDWLLAQDVRSAASGTGRQPQPCYVHTPPRVTMVSPRLAGVCRPILHRIVPLRTRPADRAQPYCAGIVINGSLSLPPVSTSVKKNKARDRNPRRWSRHTRDWSPIDTVTLNPEREIAVPNSIKLGAEKQRLAA